MADIDVTLNKNGDSCNYSGYVIDKCDNDKHVSDGSWSGSGITGLSASISGSSITVTSSNTSTSDVTQTFTWTSSKLSGCTKTLSVTAKGKAPSYAISWQISITAWLDYCGYNSNWSVNVSFDCDQHSDWTGSCLYDAIPNPGGTFDNNGSFGSTTDKTLSFSGTAYITVYTGELVTPSSISAGNTTINGEAVTTGGQTCYRYNGSISGTQSWSSSFNETSGYGIYINVTI